MAIDLLPPLWGIVGEYLTTSELWFVNELPQFAAIKQKSTRAEILKDAIANGHVDIFILARRVMTPMLTRFANTREAIARHDRLDILAEYGRHAVMRKGAKRYILRYGARRILEHMLGRGVRGFGKHTNSAIGAGRMDCLQILMRERLCEIDEHSHFSAVESDNIQMAQFVYETWPEPLGKPSKVYNGLHPLGGEKVLSQYVCQHVQSAEMAKFLIDRRDSFAICGVRLIYAAITRNSAAIAEVVVDSGVISAADALTECHKIIDVGLLKFGHNQAYQFLVSRAPQ